MKKLLFCLLVFSAVVSFADQIRLQMENDFPFHDDSDYSHGTRIEYVFDENHDYQINLKNFRLGLQQNMYTPYDISTEEQVPGRHPYAGYLVGFAGLRRERVRYSSVSLYDDIELQLGVLGPSAGGEQTQKFIHKIIGSHEPKGWKHQLHDEMVVQSVIWEGLDWRFWGEERGWSAHLEAEGGGLLGTLQTALGLNTSIKLGYGFSSVERTGEIAVRGIKAPDYSVFLLAGVEGRVWFINELLDGNAGYVHHSDALTVDKHDMTGAIRYGLGFRAKKLEVDANIMQGTREYTSQESPPDYISVTAGWQI